MNIKKAGKKAGSDDKPVKGKKKTAAFAAVSAIETKMIKNSMFHYQLLNWQD